MNIKKSSPVHFSKAASEGVVLACISVSTVCTNEMNKCSKVGSDVPPVPPAGFWGRAGGLGGLHHCYLLPGQPLAPHRSRMDTQTPLHPRVVSRDTTGS